MSAVSARLRLAAIVVIIVAASLAIGIGGARRKPSPIPPVPAASPAPRPSDVYAACAACHGPAGEGLAQVQSPRLAGQDPVYLAQQLEAFRAGWRAGPDLPAQQMTAMARLLADRAAIDAVVARIAAMPSETRGERTPGDRWRGEELYRQLCAVCHGERGQGDPVNHMARLDHQHGWYLKRQLRLYRSGARGTAEADTAGRAMAFYAGLLPDDQAVDDVVAFIVRAARTTPPPAGPPADAAQQATTSAAIVSPPAR